MNIKNLFISLIAVACLTAVSIATLAYAQEAVGSNHDMSDGVVRRIDKENGKITLRHGEIKNLNMPGMTMIFRIEDKSMLNSIQTGDKVKFKAVSKGDKLVITHIQIAEPPSK